MLDEPTVGVDPVSRRELWHIVYRLAQQEGVTVLLSTAYLDEAERCEEVILMHDGEVLGDGPPQKFRERSRGRTYTVTAPGANKRAVQESLSTAEGVVDALIQGDHVRLVMESEAQPEPAKLLPNQKDVVIKRVPPRLEDTFVTMLRKRRADVALPQQPMSPIKGPLHAHNGAGPVIDVENVKRRFGDFYAVKGVTFQVNRGRSVRFARRQRRGQIDHLSDALWFAAGYRRPFARGRPGPATRRCDRAGADRVHVAEVCALRQSERWRKPALLQQRRQSVRPTSARTHGLGVDSIRTRSHGRCHQSRSAAGSQAAVGHGLRPDDEPEILFLDEPTSGVDPLARRDFW